MGYKAVFREGSKEAMGNDETNEVVRLDDFEFQIDITLNGVVIHHRPTGLTVAITTGRMGNHQTRDIAMQFMAAALKHGPKLPLKGK